MTYSDPTPPDAQSFSRMFRSLLVTRKMNALDICEMLDVSVKTVERWITGKSAPLPEVRLLVLERVSR